MYLRQGSQMRVTFGDEATFFLQILGRQYCPFCWHSDIYLEAVEMTIEGTIKMAIPMFM